MVEVIIVSKTKMQNNHVCIGGVTSKGIFIRLLDENGYNHLDTIGFQIGEVWNIDFETRKNLISPHIEDVLVKSKKFKNTTSIKKWVSDKNIQVWKGNPSQLFDNKLKWDINKGHSTNFLKGYISKNNLSENSVGFWVSDRNLYFNSYGKYDYKSDKSILNIPYVGVNKAIPVISKGTLIRLSLARWWNKDNKTEERCYLQLSGFYI
jgi:hypothetical protein